ncbi:uncharacterized protein KZ484_007640 [Pholidichthys leucotaenia]
MESGKGELVPFKRPPKKAEGKDFMHCAYCQALFTRKILWRHMRTCILRPGSAAHKPGKNHVQSLCMYTTAVPANISKQLWEVISAMNPDLVTDIIKNDQVIIDFGQHLLNKSGMTAKSLQHVREKMQELGRLIHNARRVTTLKKMEDLVNPKNYLETVKAVRSTCGYGSETNKFLISSLATKLGNSLVKVSKLLKAQGLISNNKEIVKNASEFQDLHQEKWNELISATAMRKAKWNVPSLIPFTEDVQKLHAYLSQVQDEWHSSLSESPSTKAWMELAKVCLVQIILFNRRREGEVASMPLSAFSSRDTSDPHEDVDWALSELEKELCRHFSRIVIRGKHGRPVPILLTPKMLSALELLVKQREACGVPKDNCYMFARPEAMTHYRGSDCIRGFAKECGAQCPKALTSSRLRKHAATLSTVLNMTDTEIDQLANFLGHDIRIHREFYRLPEKTLQLAKISKVLMALEQGRLAEFHGKNLDEIGIDPDEKILASDEDNRRTQEDNYSLPTDEPSAEESPSPTERNEKPPPPKKAKRRSSRLQKMIVGDKEQQEENSSLDQNHPGIKQEEEEVDIIEFIFNPVKSEDEAENHQPGQFHHSQTEGIRDCVGGAEGDTDPHLQADNKASDSSELDVSDGDEASYNDGEKFCCGECGKRFDQKCELKQHMETHTEEKPYSCSVCNKSFKRKESINRHMKIHTGEKPYSCPMCNKSFIQKSTLIDHIRIHTGEKPYSCPVCSKTFNFKTHIKTHMRIHTGEKPYSCSVCSQTFSRKEHIKTHMRIHTGEKPYSCPVCSQTFKHKESITRHMKIHTGEKPYSCSVCNKSFNQKGTLNVHMQIHTGKKPYSCSICYPELPLNLCGGAEADPDPHVWPDHKNPDSSETDVSDGDGAERNDGKTFCCFECGKRFAHEGCLKEHMMTHASGKPYSCSVCDQTFQHKGSLTSHMRIHTGEKPYSCSVCNKSFSRKGTLNDHMRIHTGEKPYSCNFCDRRFTHKLSMKAHKCVYQCEAVRNSDPDSEEPNCDNDQKQLSSTQ